MTRPTFARSACGSECMAEQRSQFFGEDGGESEDGGPRVWLRRGGRGLAGVIVCGL